jgi:excinuclease ABC subunit A
MSQAPIRIRGARQHNLKNLDLDIQTGELTVVTGPSGSGKSSLVFDTLYAEGQRRYVETFSAYARQFLDRMDRPAVDRVDGVPPAIAIDQSNPVRSSRSTVGTMTELNDHLKLLFARSAQLFDRETAQPVRHDDAQSILADLQRRASAAGDPRLALTFSVDMPGATTQVEMEQWLSVSGFSRIHAVHPAVGEVKSVEVVADRFRMGAVEPARVAEAIETALKQGNGRLTVYVSESAKSGSNGSGSDNGSTNGNNTDNANDRSAAWRFSTGLHCPDSNIRYQSPSPGMFSFNSAVGACEACRGFGRVIGVDYGLVVPNDKLSLRGGAIKPFQTPAWAECQGDLMRHAETAGVPRDTPWNRLTADQQHWVIHGNPAYKEGQWGKVWYGVKRYFAYLETKSYKMHIRVLLSKYRSYTPCPTCAGARLKTDSLLWRLGSLADAQAVLPAAKRFMPNGVRWTPDQLQALPGLCLHDVMQLPIDSLRVFFDRMAGSPVASSGKAEYGRSGAEPIPSYRPGAQKSGTAAAPDRPSNDVALVVKKSASGEEQALQILLGEIRTRVRYLCEVGIGYLSLDRQSRTLSGGEVQRINLTTALGTSLVNTLFVLDEPSIGLHPRDMHRITQAMLRLRDAGNTLVVVEHDPAVMLQADRVIDMGPAPGERGGQIVFDGTPEALRHADTLTGVYLGGQRRVGMGLKRLVQDNTPRLILEGAREHNLKNLDISIPLQRMVVVTGVSGSGKSTLVQDVLTPALLRHFGKPTDAAGAFSRLLGADHLSDIVFVDQSPIGKTARSNPASYVGAWDAIRQIFADAPLSRQRSYTASKFSFNGGDGRCPLCGGSGFEHVEMQFLSDVYLRCPDCDGKRYRPEILEVRVDRPGALGLNVSDVLNLTVHEALQVFAGDRDVVRALQPIVDVGLDYVKLGQPVPTLSGGEAQRLKLAGHLAEAAKTASSSRQAVARKGTLFLFDEPTTGLHFDDIAKLMRSLRRLLDAGHSLLVIEHNLDVMRAADWLIDLGPEGGEAGGQLVCQGEPETVRKHPSSHTARALREYEADMGFGSPDAATNKNEVCDQEAPNYLRNTVIAKLQASPNAIQVVNAREHNLQALSVNIPRGKFNVITGVSGSGKSTLAFDIIFNEGQRRYLESLNAYARSIVQPAGRPEVDAVYGIPPTVAIEQRLSRGGRKSTVGTATEVWHFLRLLFVKLGVQHCVNDGTAVRPQTPDSIAAQILRDYRGQHIGLLAPLVVNRKGIYTELADWARPRGHTHLRVDGAFLPTTAFPRIDRFKEHRIELPVADVQVAPEGEKYLRDCLGAALTHGKGVVQVLSPLSGLRQAMLAGDAAAVAEATRGLGQVQTFSTARACPTCSTSYAELDPRLFSYNSKHGWCGECVGTGVRLSKEQRKLLDDSVRDDDQKGREQSFAEVEVEDLSSDACPACQGARLNATARAVRFAGAGIAELARRSVRELRLWTQSLALHGREADIARDLLPEITSRLTFLEEVGLGYLTLDRGAPTLSGGEAQRIRLAAQLGSNLQGVCYVLDEPTIGLHARDNAVLLKALQSLSSKGNTLIVVEHDADTIAQAEHIIDIGPGAGKRGGHVVAEGSVQDIIAHPDSLTGRYLLHSIKHPMQLRRVVGLAPLTAAVAVRAAASRAGAEPAPSYRAGAQKSVSASSPARLAVADAGEQPCLSIQSASLHNLQLLDVAVPLHRLVAITGVSGSGKSTLAREVLLANVQAAVSARGMKRESPPFTDWAGCAGVLGWEQVARVLEVDQTPIGKTPRSCPATYIGFWDTIRKLFTETLEAKARGYAAGRFSFNTGAGRCATCEGQGMRTVEMSFLPDVKVPCEACHGARFNPETLAVTWRGKSAGDVLQMEVDEAVEFFAAMPQIAHPLQLLKDVGLGYLSLGQPSPTLSGGEAQRIKLVTELSKVKDDIGKRGQKAPHTLYVLDEPTVGLHMSDVEKLIRVLHRLVDGGHSVVVIEHDLHVVAEADWVIDLGPEGGNAGGRIAAMGTPEDVVRQGGHTGMALLGVLAAALAPL